MRVLIVGAGVVGTVYGAHLAAAGHEVQVLTHPPRTDEVGLAGLDAHDVLDGSTTHADVGVLADAVGAVADLILVAVRGDQLSAACARLTGLSGSPTVVFFGNNTGGRPEIGEMPGSVVLGFPGIGGVPRGGTADYVRIKPQPTTLQAGDDPGWLSSPRRSPGAGSRSSEWPTWTAGSSIMRPSWPASPPRCTAAARTLPVWPPTGQRSG
jgi:ketopantoate reductase